MNVHATVLEIIAKRLINHFKEYIGTLFCLAKGHSTSIVVSLDLIIREHKYKTFLSFLTDP